MAPLSARPVAAGVRLAPQGSVPWIGDGFAAMPDLTGGPDTAFAASAGPDEVSTLRFAADLDLTSASQATLTFQSRLHSAHAVAEVQVSVDGVNWVAVGAVSPTDDWQQVEISLDEFLGHVVAVRFAFGVTPGEARHAVWLLRRVQMDVRR
jgi:hypothetical protein